jgi:hypothetical protein
MAKDQHKSDSRSAHDFTLDEMKKVSRGEPATTRTERDNNQKRRSQLMVVAATLPLTDPEFHILVKHDDFVLDHLCRNPHLTTGNIAEILHPKMMKRLNSQIPETDFLFNVAQLPNANENALKIVVQNANRIKYKLKGVHDKIMVNVINHKACTSRILADDIGRKWLDQNDTNPAIAPKMSSGTFADANRSVLGRHVDLKESMQEASLQDA